MHQGPQSRTTLKYQLQQYLSSAPPFNAYAEYILQHMHPKTTEAGILKRLNELKLSPQKKLDQNFTTLVKKIAATYPSFSLDEPNSTTMPIAQLGFEAELAKLERLSKETKIERTSSSHSPVCLENGASDWPTADEDDSNSEDFSPHSNKGRYLQFSKSKKPEKEPLINEEDREKSKNKKRRSSKSKGFLVI